MDGGGSRWEYEVGGGGVDLEGGVLLGKGGGTVLERKLLVRIIST